MNPAHVQGLARHGIFGVVGQNPKINDHVFCICYKENGVQHKSLVKKLPRNCGEVVKDICNP